MSAKNFAAVQASTVLKSLARKAPNSDDLVFGLGDLMLAYSYHFVARGTLHEDVWHAREAALRECLNSIAVLHATCPVPVSESSVSE